MAIDDISCAEECTKPTISATPTATQATCNGSTANSDAKIDVTGISGGDKYTYGTDSTTFTYASATAFMGSSIAITGLANPAVATTYYVRVYNAADGCYKTVSVVLTPKTCTIPCNITSVTAVPGTCTPATNKFTVNGQIIFTNPPMEGILRVRIPGKGYQDFTAPFTSPVSYSIAGLNSDGQADTVEVTFSAGACNGSAIYTAPVMCLPSACVSPQTGGTQTYTSSIPLSRTNWTNQPLTLPKFDDQGGTRILKNVLLTVNQSIRNWGVAESSDNSATEINIETTGTTSFKLNGTAFETNSFTATNYPKNVTAGILVPAQGAWPGDATFTSPPSTLFAMSATVNADLNNLVDPTLAATWVTNATGDPTDDDDMTYFKPVYSDNTKCWLYSNATDLAKFVGTGNLDLTASAAGSSSISGAGNVNSSIKTAADATVSVTYVYCIEGCVKPTASVSAKTQSICVNGTAAAYTATPNTGVEYKWYGPLTDTTGSLGTAISGQTVASFTPSGVDLTTAGTKYYAVVINNTGQATCSDTAFVALTVNAKPTAVPTTPLCHANGTPEVATDDYITFSLNITESLFSLNTFTVTATQAGNPLAITLSNGSPATAVNCGLETALRTPVGSAGKGNIILTITNNGNGCSSTVTLTDPGTCAVTCVTGTNSTVSYQYATQVDITELDQLPVILPQFDQQGGTKVLKEVKLEYVVGVNTNMIFENRAANSQSFKATATSDGFLTLNGTDIATTSVSLITPQTSLPAGVLVSAQGNWPGDVVSGGVPSTLAAMPWIDQYMTLMKDPRIDPRWVTTATGQATNDDDIYYSPVMGDTVQGTITYTLAPALAPFIGTGSVPLTVSTLSGFGLSGGGGNIFSILRTRGYAGVKVTYTYECVDLCVKPIAKVTPKTQTICIGSSVAAYSATPSTGVEYKWYGPLTDTTGSLGTAISGQTVVSFTPSGVDLTTAGTKYYAVVINIIGQAACADTAFVQLIVNAKPAIIDGLATICSGESVDLTSKITGYATLLSPVWTITTAAGSVVATPTAVKPTTTTTYVLVAQNAAGCKDTANVVVIVNPKPDAGTDQTLACANAGTNTLATSTTLVPSPTGGNWAQIGATPTAATITGNNVTAMTMTGTYSFIYTLNGCSDTVAVTVEPCSGCVKPNAGTDAPAVCQPTATAKLTAITAGGTWAPIGSPANPAAATIDASGNIIGLTAAGTYKFVYSVTGGGQTCTDTAQVIVNAKPAIIDGLATICPGESVDLTSKITGYATLLSPVWTITTAAGSVVATPNAVKPTMTTTYVLVAQNAAGCKDTANVVVTVNPKPDAGVDIVGVNAICTSTGTVSLTGTPANGTWAQLGITPSTATINAGGVVSGMTSVGTYQFIYTINGCIDTVTVETKNCAVGSIGDLIWKDTNDNGLQDLPTEKGVAGITVNLYAAAGGTKTGAILQTKTTAADGLYLFSNLMAGDYIVEIDKTTLPDTCEITAKQNIPSDDAKDSDFNPTTGLSQVITLNPVFNPTTAAELLATNNLTVDAGLTVPCVKSKVTLTGAPICSVDVQTYSLTFNLTNKIGIVKVNKGTLIGNNPYTVTGIPSGATITITDSLSAVCKFDTLITGPNCNCNPPVPILLTPSLTACIGDTFPTIMANVVGFATVEWFTSASGGTVLFTGLSYKPSGTVAAGGTVLYAQARSTDPTCLAAISTTRVPATINAQDCTKEVDLALKKYINKKIVQIGDELTYTVKVFNQSNTAATGVEVTDSIATTVQFVTGSFVPNRGSATISGNVIKWVIGGIAANPGANGDTVTLVYKVKATQVGLHFNTAEISKTNEKDVDSTPDNGTDSEDDIDHQCFTVPIKLCTGAKVEATVSAQYSNVQWFKNGSTTPIATGNVVLLSEVGTYTFTSTNHICPEEGCCPIVIEAGINCCLPQICVPLTVKKIK